jgi:hypothetical protein
MTAVTIIHNFGENNHGGDEHGGYNYAGNHHGGDNHGGGNHGGDNHDIGNHGGDNHGIGNHGGYNQGARIYMYSVNITGRSAEVPVVCLALRLSLFNVQLLRTVRQMDSYLNVCQYHPQNVSSAHMSYLFVVLLL